MDGSGRRGQGGIGALMLMITLTILTAGVRPARAMPPTVGAFLQC